ncbi:hypothetical protein WKH57_01220 [Niallia taxi]|uniref:hypothetical protein n=1 Tax=Niallia taxi TaxID=2499688 RepID=UPI0031766745
MYTKESQYDAKHCKSIEAASCMFVDEICGELDVNLIYNKLIETDHEIFWEENIVTEDNRKLIISISYEEDENAYFCECVEEEK